MTKPSSVSTERISRARPGDEILPTSYRKRPVVIEAIRWSGTNLKELIDFTGLHPSADKWTWEEYEAVVREKGLKIFSLEGSNFIVTLGDFIIKGVKGEFYACKPDIFAMTYDRADAVVSETGVDAADAARWRDACMDPSGYAHLFSLLAAGKGTVESLNLMADRIGISRRAAMSKGLGPGPRKPLEGAK